MSRPSRARIDVNALRSNYNVAKRRHGARVLAVLKANAYGHGAIRCARALGDVADGYAVAFLDEALALRSAGIRGPILLLEGTFGADEFDTVCQQNLWTVVHQESQLRMIEEARPARDVVVWLKVDSGMHRAGFAPAEIRRVHGRLAACGNVSNIVMMTHLARADEPGDDATLRQIDTFMAATDGLRGGRSLCNSAGILSWPSARSDWARPGLLLYGIDPVPGGGHGLEPVMTLESEIFAVRTLHPGEALGYGGRFVAQRPTKVGLVAIGYADGYPQSAPDGTPVTIDERPASLIGRVSMDMLTVDITDLPGAGPGSQVQLWGKHVGVGVVARAAGTSAYELLCNVKRVPLTYEHAGALMDAATLRHTG